MDCFLLCMVDDGAGSIDKCVLGILAICYQEIRFFLDVEKFL